MMIIIYDCHIFIVQATGLTGQLFMLFML